MSETDKYIDFLKWCLDTSLDRPNCIDTINWHALLEFAKSQAIVGVYWCGIKKLGELKVNKPVDDDILEWMATYKKIEKNNLKLNKLASWAWNNFESENFDALILKGQGNAIFYPDPFSRTSGDIDILVAPKLEKTLGILSPKDEIKKVIRYCKNIFPEGKACYHHIGFIKKEGIEIEVHYRASWLNNPWNNKRIQQFFYSGFKDSVSNKIELPEHMDLIGIPSWNFNLIYQQVHILNHVTHFGIGLRQIVDYYYLLKSQTSNGQDFKKIIKFLGLKGISESLMWVLSEKLGLEDKYLISESNEKSGRFLFDEILTTGNFGHYDKRFLGVFQFGNEYLVLKNSAVYKNVDRLIRDIRLFRYFPSECFWEPYFRIYHFFWRLKYNSR